MSFLETFKNRRESLLIPMDQGRRTGIIFFSMSLFFHGLFFCGLIFFQDFKRPKPLPPVIQIDLVSFSPEPVLEEPGKKEETTKNEALPVKPAPLKKTTRKIPAIKPDISLKTKPKNLKDLVAQQEKKQKTPDKEKEKKIVEKEKIERKIEPEADLEETDEDLTPAVEEPVPDQTNARISEALSRLQKKVQEQGEAKEVQGKGTSTQVGKKGYKPIDLYKMILGQTIEQNWVFNDILARMDQKLEVRILIKILKSGEIRDIIYETKSGNRYLDESAKKAIKKTNPLPQLPSGMHSYDVVVIFTPRGLK